MKNTKIIIIVVVVIGGLLFLNTLGKTKDPNNQTNTISQIKEGGEPSYTPQSKLPADKIQVVNFYGNQRCPACLTLGQLTKRTIEEKFAKEVGEGKIEFVEVNGELPQNRDTVIKYQARGSSLYLNAIVGDKDNIEEEVTVWRLINSEEKFVSYLEGKIRSLL